MPTSIHVESALLCLVRWTVRGVACDSCQAWFHASCMGMCNEVYFAKTSNVSWVCCICGLSNLSSDVVASVLAESVKQNHSSLIDVSHASTDTTSSSVRTETASRHAYGPAIPYQLLLCSKQHWHTVPHVPISSATFPPPPTISATYQYLLGNHSLRTLIVNFQSLHPPKSNLVTWLVASTQT